MMSLIKLVFQSTLPVRGATAAEGLSTGISEFQSTLPVRGATWQGVQSAIQYEFQSTLPVRGATLQPFPAIVFPDDFNPRSPCGERRRIRPGQTHDGNISIHAPRAGSDSCYTAGLYNPAHFNPRSPCGERHDRDRHSGSRDAISIHAPRAGGDDVQYIHYSLFMEFQSTPPVRGATGRAFYPPLP